MASDPRKAARERMQPLDADVRDQQQLAGLHARHTVSRDHVRLHHDRHAGLERLLWNWPGRAALATRLVEGNCAGTPSRGSCMEVVPIKWMTLVPPSRM